MSSLPDLQRQFLHTISQERPSPTEKPLTAIYRNAYFTRLEGVLEEDYPALRHRLGDEAFAQLSRHYCLEHPPSHFSLRQFGEQLPIFLARTPPYDQQPLLAELAEWERQLRFLFDCTDAPPLSATCLQAVAPEDWSNLIFTMVPACRLMCLHASTVDDWKAFKEHRERRPAENNAITHWLLWRRDWITHFRSLGEDEYAALEELMRGHTFAAICEALWSNHEEQAPPMAARFLQTWFNEGLIQQVQLAESR
ncbi:MAG: putative DNA-binding domain-containing protein [Hahellaceae bacterium]|nr:putative DNA-binding domain-containing protein [Hahellaceae bacterium]